MVIQRSGQKQKEMHNYKNLDIWKEAMTLARQIYEVTKNFPDMEKFGIVSQMTRAAVSVPSNIAEGAGRETDKDFIHFLSIAVGSLFELNTQIQLSEQIGYLTKEQSLLLQDQITKLECKTAALKERLRQ